MITVLESTESDMEEIPDNVIVLTAEEEEILLANQAESRKTLIFEKMKVALRALDDVTRVTKKYGYILRNKNNDICKSNYTVARVATDCSLSLKYKIKKLSRYWHNFTEDLTIQDYVVKTEKDGDKSVVTILDLPMSQQKEKNDTRNSELQNPNEESAVNNDKVVTETPANKKSNKRCDKCNKTFARRQTYLSHMNIHAGINFACSICSKVFHDAGQFSSHQNSHIGEGIKCDQCDKTFNTKSALNMHKPFHGKPRYYCNTCKQGFYWKADLRKHLDIHDVNLWFTCNICKKQFSSINGMRTHRTIHFKKEN